VGVQANWHSELVLAEEADPFGERRIEDVGTPIEIGAGGDAGSLQAQLVHSLAAEGELDAAGVRCAIKDARDTSCHACPLYLDDGSPEARLCAIGRLQETLCTQITVLHRGGRR
jgi:hypothetical protein